MIRGYDSSQLYREEVLLRIKLLESEINDCAKRMNEIIRKENLPEELVDVPYPEADDPEYE